MEKKVSLIVPVYNGENYLKDCVDSILGQTLREIEILLVDDGSKDRTPQLCDAYAAADERVRVIHQENRGLGMARNAGLDAAEGIYVTFVDSDDYISGEMCEKMYQAAEQYQTDMVLAGLCQEGGSLFSGETVDEVCCFPREEIFDGEQGRQRLMFGIIGAEPWEDQDSRYNFSACKNLYRTGLIQTFGLRFFSERKVISEDVIFLLDVVSHVQKAVGIPGAFYHYRRNTSSITRTYREGLFEQFLQLERMIEERVKEYLPEQDVVRCTDRLLQARARVALASEVQYGLAKGAGFFQTRGQMRRITGNERLRRTLRRYPYWKLPKKQALFAFAMRYRLSLLQYLLIYLRERGR